MSSLPSDSSERAARCSSGPWPRGRRSYVADEIAVKLSAARVPVRPWGGDRLGQSTLRLAAASRSACPPALMPGAECDRFGHGDRLGDGFGQVRGTLEGRSSAPRGSLPRADPQLLPIPPPCDHDDASHFCPCEGATTSRPRGRLARPRAFAWCERRYVAATRVGGSTQ